MKWKYLALRTSRWMNSKKQSWIKFDITKVSEINHQQEVLAYLARIMQFINDCPVPYYQIELAGSELRQIESVPFYRGVRIFCIPTGLELTYIAMYGDEPISTEALVIEMLRGDVRLRDVRGLHPILSQEGSVLHIAVDCDIDPADLRYHDRERRRKTFDAEVFRPTPS